MAKKTTIISAIVKAVTESAKKGKLVATKYVGAYEYKSGYDTFFAVGFDKDKNVVVYSYYQNDRCEHIDTIAYPLNKLTEKQLNEVAENLNTKDKEILGYVERTHLDDKYQDVVAKLGLFTPKKKANNDIDINKIRRDIQKIAYEIGI